LQLLAAATMAPNLTLYTDNTPNGFKASVTLEELGLEYETKHIKISTGAQKKPDFLKINPNGRIPAMVDHSADDLRVFETGSIMLYLCEYYDKEHKLLPADRKNRTEAINWLMWQMGGLGPMQGQANHFTRYAPERVQYGIDRYTNETRRLYKVLDTALDGKEFLVDNKFSIADIASYCWVVSAQWAIEGFEYDEFPNMKAWKERIDARPATKRGMAVPEPSDLASAAKDPKRLAEIKESVQSMMVKKGD
jgi:glutathione S-transferase